MADSPPGITAAPKDDNLRHFDVTVAGPDQSPYEGDSALHSINRTELMWSGGIFKLELFLPEEYPMNPPKVRFLTKI